MDNKKRSSLILLDSPEGQQMLKEVIEEGKYHQPNPHVIFAKQIGRRNCGIQSLAMLISASRIPQNQGVEALHSGVQIEPAMKEAQMFSFQETNAIASQEMVDKRGLTLDEVVDIAKSHGYSTEKHHAEDTSSKDFRTLVKFALSKTDSKLGINVNYDMVKLGQGENLGGHHSPIVSYHEKSDRFLILDTWPETKECWACAEDLFNAMNTIDSDSKKTRGFCVITFP